MADYDLETLSLTELKKMQKDIAKAISTFEDRQRGLLPEGAGSYHKGINGVSAICTPP